MADFKVEMEVTVPATDADIMAIFSEAVSDCFDGTPVTIKKVTVMQVIYQDETEEK